MAVTSKWTNHIRAWQLSGLKQSAYCRQQGLNRNTFAARLSDYRKEQKGTLPALIPIRLESSTSGSLILKHAKGHQVDMPLTISATWLAELLRCLD